MDLMRAEARRGNRGSTSRDRRCCASTADCPRCRSPDARARTPRTCLDSRSNTGSHTGRPLAPCRNSSGGPEPPRSIRTLTSRTLCFVSVPGMALFSCHRCAAIYRPALSLQSRGPPMAAADTERFRLRRFVERLVQLGECEVHDTADRSRRRRRGARRQSARDLVQGGRAGEGRADRQRHGFAQAPRSGARHR